MSLKNPSVAFRQQFQDSFNDALQQRQSRLQVAVTDRGSIDGSSFTINNIGSTEMQPVNSRYEDKRLSEVDNNTRVVYMSDFDDLIAVEGFDVPKLSADPSFKYVDLLVAAAGRRKDKTIYRAMIDSVITKTGEATFGSTAMPSTQIILAGATTFTKAKLIFSKKLFRQNEGDEQNGEELYIAYDDTMLSQILSDTTLTSADYMAVKMLQEGAVAGKWLGYNWIPYQALDNGAGGSTERRTVAWAKSGIHFGLGIETKTKVGENEQKRGHPTEAYAWMSLGAGRQDEKKVVLIDYVI